MILDSIPEMSLVRRVLSALFSQDMSLEELYSSLPIQDKVEIAPMIFDLSAKLVDEGDYTRADALLPVLKRINRHTRGLYAKELHVLEAQLAPPPLPSEFAAYYAQLGERRYRI
jgi:hypothetical protein